MDDPAKVAKELELAKTYVLSVTTTPKAFPKTSRLVKKGGRIRTAIGYHPQLVAERPHEMPLFEKMLHETRYVGEVGLDGGREFKNSKEAQTKIFATILALCKSSGPKIISIHSRHAANAVLDEIAKNPDCGTPVLHWFTGNHQELDRAIRMGCWFSVGAPMLGTAKGKAAVALMPKERVLTETDAPFAASNIGASLRSATKTLASIWDMDVNEATNAMKSNLAALVA